MSNACVDGFLAELKGRYALSHTAILARAMINDQKLQCEMDEMLYGQRFMLDGQRVDPRTVEIHDDRYVFPHGVKGKELACTYAATVEKTELRPSGNWLYGKAIARQVCAF